MPKAVFCQCCQSLVGYFPGGVDEAVDHYGPGCPWCSRPTHHMEDEKIIQRDAHLAFAADEESGSAFIEVDDVRSNYTGPAPDVVAEKHTRAVEATRSYATSVRSGRTVAEAVASMKAIKATFAPTP